MITIKTHIAASKIDGLGCFADEPIAAGAVVWRFDPRTCLILPDECVLLPDSWREFVQRYGCRDPRFGDQWLICADNARFFNHSDTPTLTSCADVDVAAVDIAVGDELTIDYRIMEPSRADREWLRR